MIPFYQLVLTGLGIGLLVAAPVGPVNIMCIQRALCGGVLSGLLAGLGAVLGDGLIALVAVLGLQAVSGFILDHRTTIQSVGGVILVVFGLKLYFASPRLNDDDASMPAGGNGNGNGNGNGSRIRRNLLLVPQTFFLTVTNPGAVLGMFAIMSGVGTAMGGLFSKFEAMTLVVSIMAGSLLWWLGLSWGISHIRHMLNLKTMKRINHIAGAALVMFGLALVLEVWLTPPHIEPLVQNGTWVIAAFR